MGIKRNKRYFFCFIIKAFPVFNKFNDGKFYALIRYSINWEGV